MSFGARTSLTLRALHALLDPLIRVHTGRRVHTFRWVAHNVDDLRFPALLVEAIGAVRRFGDALVAITERHLHVAGRTFEFDALERGSDCIGGRLCPRLGGLLVGELETKQRLRHLVSWIGWWDVVAVRVNLLEPLVDRGVGRQRAVGT